MLNTRIFPSASGALPVELQSLGNDCRFAYAIIGIAFTKLGDGVAKHGKDALGFEVPAQIPERALTKAGEAAHSDLHQSNLAKRGRSVDDFFEENCRVETGLCVE